MRYTPIQDLNRYTNGYQQILTVCNHQFLRVCPKCPEMVDIKGYHRDITEISWKYNVDILVCIHITTSMVLVLSEKGIDPTKYCIFGQNDTNQKDSQGQTNPQKNILDDSQVTLHKIHKGLSRHDMIHLSCRIPVPLLNTLPVVKHRLSNLQGFDQNWNPAQQFYCLNQS